MLCTRQVGTTPNSVVDLCYIGSLEADLLRDRNVSEAATFQHDGSNEQALLKR